MAQNPQANNSVLETQIEEFLENSGTMQNIKGITDESMESLYAYGYNLYNTGKFDRAHKVFQFLSIHNPFEKKYWLALGGCRQMTKNYEGAVEAYAYASMLDTKDPTAIFHAADCMLRLNNRQGAEAALHTSIRFAGDQPQYATIKENAQNVLNLMYQTGPQSA